MASPPRCGRRGRPTKVNRTEPMSWSEYEAHTRRMPPVRLPPFAWSARRRHTARTMLITVEGLDGAGKTTLITALAEHLDATVLREPGGVELSERIRDLVADPALHVDPRAEALLYAAARAQLVAEKLRPLLDAGETVLLDRFVDSSLAYQGGGRELGVEEIRALNAFGTGGLTPDRTLLLRIDPEDGPGADRRPRGRPARAGGGRVLRARGSDLRRAGRGRAGPVRRPRRHPAPRRRPRRRPRRPPMNRALALLADVFDGLRRRRSTSCARAGASSRPRSARR